MSLVRLVLVCVLACGLTDSVVSIAASVFIRVAVPATSSLESDPGSSFRLRRHSICHESHELLLPMLLSARLGRNVDIASKNCSVPGNATCETIVLREPICVAAGQCVCSSELSCAL